MEHYQLLAYWAVRQDCRAMRRPIAMFLTNIAECGPPLTIWHSTATSRARSLRSVLKPDDAQALRLCFLKGRAWRDIPRTVMEDLGFTVGLWNGGNQGVEVGISISCGCYNTKFTNSVIISWFDGLGGSIAGQDSASLKRSLLLVAGSGVRHVQRDVLSRHSNSLAGGCSTCLATNGLRQSSDCATEARSRFRTPDRLRSFAQPDRDTRDDPAHRRPHWLAQTIRCIQLTSARSKV